MPSTVISKIEYDEGQAKLTITFVSGVIYVYKNVPAHIYAELKLSRAKGIYLNKHIKGLYDFERLER